MKVRLNRIRVSRGDWSLSADGVFEEGIHLVSGDVGSGKSTLALLLAGMVLQESGTIERTGIVSAMIGCQIPEFHVTGADLERECKAWGVDPRTTIATAGLAGRETENPFDLSRGELKRLINTCILAKNHDLLVLDEPFSSLDCREKERLCSSLSGRLKGITIIFTHEQAHFPRVDRIWEIQEGALCDRGGLPSALGRWNHAPPLIKNLIERGRIPGNISQADLLEAACRT